MSNPQESPSLGIWHSIMTQLVLFSSVEINGQTSAYLVLSRHSGLPFTFQPDVQSPSSHPNV